jgi:hypothetical protein
VHLQRLVDLEYVIAHRAARGQGFSYELVYDGRGQDGQPFLSGLLDVEALRDVPTTPGIPASEPSIRGRFGPDSAPFRGGVGCVSPSTGLTESGFESSAPNDAHLDEPTNGAVERSLPL